MTDGSPCRSAHANAYFTGFGAEKRIVFFDTLIDRLTTPEIEAVLAHELGHFARGHIPRLLAVRFALALLMLAILGWLYRQGDAIEHRQAAEAQAQLLDLQLSHTISCYDGIA